MIGISVGEEVRAKSKSDELKLMVCFKVGLSHACDSASCPSFVQQDILLGIWLNCRCIAPVRTAHNLPRRGSLAFTTEGWFQRTAGTS